MLPDVVGEERTDRDHLESAFSRRFQGEADERGANTLSLVGRRHFGVGEDDLAVEQLVVGNGKAAVTEVDLEAVLLTIVADGIVGRWSGHRAAIAKVRGHASRVLDRPDLWRSLRRRQGVPMRKTVRTWLSTAVLVSFSQ